MRQSQLFTKTRREAPKDEVAKNAQLLIRGGFIHKEMAGVYDFLPLGLRTLNKIMNVIRQEMDTIRGQEVFLSSLQDPQLWSKTGRWNQNGDIDAIWLRTVAEDKGFAFTHEEPMTALMTEQVSSYKDLPKYVYQFQTKFRNEPRAKSGILRCREFIMKDLYSFSRSEEEHQKFYEKAAAAYERIFSRCGLGERTYKTFASGGSFSKYSHEYQTVCDAGEDIVYVNKEKRMAINKEVFTDEVKKEIGVSGDFEELKTIEVGNIFTLGTKFSEPLGLTFKDENGKDTPVFMGSYGIGPGRLMGTIVEVLSDKKGIVWPREVAPFQVHLISITGGNEEVVKEADRLYELLQDTKIEVLYDDRDVRAGEKFADADLIGIPKKVIVSEKTMGEGGVEVSSRSDGVAQMVSDSEFIDFIQK